MLDTTHWGEPIEYGIGYKIYNDPYPVTSLHLIYVIDDVSTLGKCFELAYARGCKYVEQGIADGFNIGLNYNECAGQMVQGMHIHLIMRSTHDCNHSAGGVRKVIDGQGDFSITSYVHPSRGDISDEILEKFNHLHFDKFASLFGSGNVPGYFADGDIAAVEQIVGMLPTNSRIVELGSFLGKSAVIWAEQLINQGKQGTIVCIDTFQASPTTLNMLLEEAEFDVPPGELNQSEMFDYYTKDWPNIQKLQCLFDKNFVWNLDVDCAFEDSDHSEKTLSISLPFWWDCLKSQGILCGHDYTLLTVKKMVDLFALEKQVKVQLFNNSSIWMIRKP